MDTLGAAIGPVVALILLNFYPNNFQLVFLIAFIPSVIALSLLLVKDKQVASKIKFRKIIWSSGNPHQSSIKKF